MAFRQSGVQDAGCERIAGQLALPGMGAASSQVGLHQHLGAAGETAGVEPKPHAMPS